MVIHSCLAVAVSQLTKSFATAEKSYWSPSDSLSQSEA
jgi:hypothetical protein